MLVLALAPFDAGAAAAWQPRTGCKDELAAVHNHIPAWHGGDDNSVRRDSVDKRDGDVHMDDRDGHRDALAWKLKAPAEPSPMR